MASIRGFAESTVDPFLATKNFSLLETQSHYPVEYSTGSDANWNVLSWGQPSGVIWNPFSIQDQSSTSKVFSSSTLKTSHDPMTVSFQINPKTDAWTSTTLGQTATTTCQDSGDNPIEFDLFVQPNSSAFVPTNPSGILPPSGYPGGALPNLGEITTIEFKGTATVVKASQSTSSIDCGVNQSGAMVSLVLNSTNGQTLYYQLDLSLECYPGAFSGEGCYGYKPTEYFFSGSNPYGIDDPISSYSGQSLLAPGHSINMSSLNLASRLKNLIESGSPDGTMNTHLADWFITGMYFGQHAWGRANLETKWSGNFLLSISY